MKKWRVKEEFVVGAVKEKYGTKVKKQPFFTFVDLEMMVRIQINNVIFTDVSFAKGGMLEEEECKVSPQKVQTFCGLYFRKF
ncbi:MAG: hypothetical protein WC933_01620 [Candidatus Paceibacterota bacterium]